MDYKLEAQELAGAVYSELSDRPTLTANEDYLLGKADFILSNSMILCKDCATWYFKELGCDMCKDYN